MEYKPRGGRKKQLYILRLSDAVVDVYRRPPSLRQVSEDICEFLGNSDVGIRCKQLLYIHPEADFRRLAFPKSSDPINVLGRVTVNGTHLFVEYIDVGTGSPCYKLNREVALSR